VPSLSEHHLPGDALAWYIGLDPQVKSEWHTLKREFLNQFAEGISPTIAALNELKQLRQGTRPMKSFGPEITTLLNRAQIYDELTRLDYLKDRHHPELERAVITSGAITLQKGIQVATDMERALSRSKGTTMLAPMASLRQEPTTAATATTEQANSQGQASSRNRKEKHKC
jgi:hypothetical protein